MLLVLAVILAVLWLAGFLVFHIASALIHLLLLVAIGLAVWHFVRRR